jgi:heptosyltransferase III
MHVKNILIIIRRSNGDVLFSAPLIEQLQNELKPNSIDLMVNDDTIAIAKTLPNIRQIISFSYKERQRNRWKQEKKIVRKIYRKYDLSINLTANDGCIIYALLASKNAISAVEKTITKSWWKKLFLKHYYHFDNQQHILLNNLESLSCLGIHASKKLKVPENNKAAGDLIKRKLDNLKISKFIIFHPSAQYHYKIYPQNLRNEVLRLLDKLNINVIVTGGSNLIDTSIKDTIPSLQNITNWIGQTSIDEYIALSGLSQGYIGMDTLNMHIAAGQNKRVFAIFGPTGLSMWSPWSNLSQKSAKLDMPVQHYDNVTIFQADMPCVACGAAGCNGSGKSECLNNIDPRVIIYEVQKWLKNEKF